MTEFTNPSVIELSVLRGVDGCLWSNAINDSRMSIDVSPLLKVLHVSDSATKDNKLRIF